MSHEIKILSAYNGRLHESTIRRAEELIGIEVDGEVVYFDKRGANEYGVTLEDGPKLTALMDRNRLAGAKIKRPKRLKT